MNFYSTLIPGIKININVIIENLQKVMNLILNEYYKNNALDYISLKKS